MARLPIPGSDDGKWGQILNEYLSQSLNADGTLKASAINKDAIGLGNVDNTHDADKPISNSMQTALNSKLDTASLDLGIASYVQNNSSDTSAALGDSINETLHAAIEPGGELEQLSALGKSYLSPQAQGGMLDGLKCDIFASGDSQTGYLGGGAVGRFPRWPEVTAFYLGVTVRNNAVGGEQPYDTSFRAGSKTLAFALPANTLPGDTNEFAVTLLNPTNNFSFSGQGSDLPSDTSNFPFCLADGEPVSLRLSNDKIWYMRRLIAGGDLAVPNGGVKVRCLGGQTHRNHTLHIWATGNNDADPTRNALAEQELINWIDPDTSDYLILSTYPTPTQLSGSQGYTNKTTLNTNRSNAYGIRYFDSYGYLLNEALQDALDYGLLSQPDSEDANDIAQGTIPRSLRVSSTDQHINWIGHRLLGIKLARHILNKNLLSKSKGANFHIDSTILPVLSSDLTGPQQINISSGGSISRDVDATIKALQSFSLRTLVKPSNLNTTQIIARNDTDGARVWSLRFISSGVLRWTWYPDGTNTNSIQNNSGNPSPAIAQNEWRWVRVDFDATERRTRYYLADDNGSSEPTGWSQIGSDIVSAATILPNNDASLKVFLEGATRRVQLKSYDGSTSFIDDNFETNNIDTNVWTLTNASAGPLEA